MKVLGLTGGIASGKSAITEWLADKGAYVIDADKLGHRVYESGSRAFEKVVQTFGEDIVDEDGEINRRILGSKVFGDEAALKKLTDIAWPAIKEMAQDEINEVRTAGTQKLLVLEAAVLIEANWMDIVDELWVVTVDRDVAIERTMERDSLTREDVEKRIDAQLTNEVRMKHADVTLDNSRTWPELWDQVDSAYHHSVANT